MGCVFSTIEDNHIHHINNMMELGGAEISGIKLHAAIDVLIRRNHIHHNTMGIWLDWEALELHKICYMIMMFRKVLLS